MNFEIDNTQMHQDRFSFWVGYANTDDIAMIISVAMLFGAIIGLSLR
jgi:hypothetical protein